MSLTEAARDIRSRSRDHDDCPNRRVEEGTVKSVGWLIREVGCDRVVSGSCVKLKAKQSQGCRDGGVRTRDGMDTRIRCNRPQQTGSLSGSKA